MNTEHDTTPDPDRDALYKLFEDSPGDLAAYGGMADRLDELGYASLAYAYRWMQRRGKWPHKRTHYVGDLHQRKVPARFRWAWYAEDVQREGRGPSGREVAGVLPGSRHKWHSLPPLLLPGEQKVYASHQAAVMDLAKWLDRLRDAYALDGPKGAPA